MRIRRFKAGDEPVLRSVFFSSVHDLTGGHYSLEQQFAWAPVDHDPAAWARRIRDIQPFLAEVDGAVAGYADLQPSGYIDHFYVAGAFARHGVGRALMNHLLARARSLRIPELWSHVSLTAEPFFSKYGFQVEARNEFLLRGVTLVNATMRKSLPT
jgi:putative acetyltransferase